MATKQLSNAALSTVPLAITNVQLTIALVSSAQFPGVGDFPVRIDDINKVGYDETVDYELALCTANNTGTGTLTVTRGVETGAKSFLAGAQVTAPLTKKVLTDGFGRIDAPYGAPFTVGGRFLGALTVGGAPASGTWVANDYGFDSSGLLWICTVGGTPGTWVTIPRGNLGYAQVTADQGGITGSADLTSLTLTLTVGTSRRIRVTGSILCQSTVATDQGVLLILADGAQVQQSMVPLQLANTTYGVIAQAILQPAAGARTYKLQGARLGTGTLTVKAAAGNPAFILVEDLGT